MTRIAITPAQVAGDAGPADAQGLLPVDRQRQARDAAL